MIQGIYVVTDGSLRHDRSHEDIVQAAIAGGAKVVQLRAKELPTFDLIDLARRLTAMAERFGVTLVVNDRVDIVLESGAHGVHLGPDDCVPSVARALLGPDKIIGVSVSSVEEATPLAEFASYLGVGAIYGSTTKNDAGDAVGTDRIRELKTALPNMPLVAIGGITLDRLVDVRSAGADSAAVISAVVCAADMEAATRSLVHRWHLV